MIQILKTELNLLKGPRLIIPFVSIFIVITTLALLYFTAGHGDYGDSPEAIRYAVNQLLSSTLIGLLFMLWMLQHQTHQWLCGYYQMLISFSMSRHQLYLYNIFQIIIYTFIFAIIEFAAITLAGVFYHIWPWEIFLATDANTLLSQLLMLWSLGLVAALISTLKSNYYLALPLLFYWLLESWGVKLIEKHYDISVPLPLNSLQSIINNQVLSISQLVSITIFFLIFCILFNHLITKKNVTQ